MKIYVTGSRGMVGSRFLELLPSGYEVVSPEVDRLDVTDKAAVDAFFEKEKPEVVVHFAAYTNVGEGENQRDDKQSLASGAGKNGDAWKINVDGSKNLGEASQKGGAHFIHISTDYVFSGMADDPGPYAEDHSPEADSKKVTWYGFTKAEAEREISKILQKNFSIMRLIYPVRAKFEAKMDYLRKPLSLYDQGKLYPMFTDQQVSFTFIDEACAALVKIIESRVYGVFHASTPDVSSPHQIISYLIEKARGVRDAVKPSSLDEFLKTVDSPVRYPKFGGLKVEKTEKTLGIKFSSWKEVIDKLVEQGLGSTS